MKAVYYILILLLLSGCTLFKPTQTLQYKVEVLSGKDVVLTYYNCTHVKHNNKGTYYFLSKGKPVQITCNSNDIIVTEL